MSGIDAPSDELRVEPLCNEAQISQHTLWMGPNKLKLVLAAAEREELRQALKTLTDPRSRDRVRAVQLATTGQHTHEEIALLVGRARSTI